MALPAFVAATLVLAACSSGGPKAPLPTIPKDGFPRQSLALGPGSTPHIGAPPASTPHIGAPPASTPTVGGAPGVGTGDPAKGTIHVVMSGAASRTVDLPFAPDASLMAITPTDSYLMFTDGKAAAFMTISATSVTFQYADGAFNAAAGDPCEIHLTRSSTGAKGSFRCSNAVFLAPAMGMGAVEATFDAHQ